MHRDDQEPEHQPHQLHVQAHIAIEDVAELMPDHTLQLIAIQVLERPVGHGNGGIGRTVTGSEGVDPGFLFEHVDLGHGNTGGDRHFLDDVAQPLAARILGVGFDAHAPERTRHHRSAGSQLL